jgi:hypothetical protein
MKTKVQELQDWVEAEKKRGLVDIKLTSSRIRDLPAYFKNDGDKQKMFDAADRCAETSKEQFEKAEAAASEILEAIHAPEVPDNDLM